MVICITGPMAAGKNYICSKYEKEGWLSIDCDVVVHDAVDAMQSQILEVFGEIAKNLGVSLLNKNGKIHRRNLGSILFNNPELLHKQEEIVYPYVIQIVKRFIDENSSSNLIINATVLYKIPELMALCDSIVFVTAPKILRFIRAKKRDKMSMARILQRFKAQKNLLNEYKKSGKKIMVIHNF